MKQVYEYFVILFMFKNVNNLVPNVFKCMFKKNLDVCSYQTRQMTKLYKPKAKTTVLQKSISHIGITLWNNIIDNIDVNCVIYTIKKRLSEYQLSLL